MAIWHSGVRAMHLESVQGGAQMGCAKLASEKQNWLPQKCLVDGTSEVHLLRMSRAKTLFLMNFGTKFGTTFWMASSRKGACFGGQVLKTRSRTSLWKQASLEMDKGWPYAWVATRGKPPLGGHCNLFPTKQQNTKKSLESLLGSLARLLG